MPPQLSWVTKRPSRRAESPLEQCWCHVRLLDLTGSDPTGSSHRQPWAAPAFQDTFRIGREYGGSHGWDKGALTEGCGKKSFPGSLGWEQPGGGWLEHDRDTSRWSLLMAQQSLKYSSH